MILGAVRDSFEVYNGLTTAMMKTLSETNFFGELIPGILVVGKPRICLTRGYLTPPVHVDKWRVGIQADVTVTCGLAENSSGYPYRLVERSTVATVAIDSG